jgi:hypothetical protein
MLTLAWAELSELTMRIEHLQSRRSTAKLTESVGAAKALAEALDHAMSERDRVVSQITARISAGALHQPPARADYRHAA